MAWNETYSSRCDGGLEIRPDLVMMRSLTFGFDFARLGMGGGSAGGVGVGGATEESSGGNQGISFSPSGTGGSPSGGGMIAAGRVSGEEIGPG